MKVVTWARLYENLPYAPTDSVEPKIEKAFVADECALIRELNKMEAFRSKIIQARRERNFNKEVANVR